MLLVDRSHAAKILGETGIQSGLPRLWAYISFSTLQSVLLLCGLTGEASLPAVKVRAGLTLSARLVTAHNHNPTLKLRAPAISHPAATHTFNNE